ncbi:hypothetical protein M1271_07000 [Patescibacteria group bacterium]|nr:hypothetical protein [Patescibacteria group bacterium]MCL5798127.1 hypothetical protein [Patescibacteria group bacterium]
MNNPQDDTHLVKVVFALVLCAIILLGSLYVSYRYSQLQPSDIILPGGVTYLGPTSTSFH